MTAMLAAAGCGHESYHYLPRSPHGSMLSVPYKHWGHTPAAPAGLGHVHVVFGRMHTVCRRMHVVFERMHVNM